MNLTPYDLGPDSCGKIVEFRRRLQKMPMFLKQAMANSEKTPPAQVPNSFLSRILGYALPGWIIGFFIQAILIPVVPHHFFHNYPSLIMVTGFVGAGITIAFGFGREFIMKRRPDDAYQKQPVTEIEIKWTLHSVEDNLKKEHLNTALILLKTTISDLDMQNSVRNTLRFQGEAIDGLPYMPSKSLSFDPQDLRDKSRSLSLKAENEPDPIIKTSLLRQASTISTQAETVSRAAALVRRSQALREEVSAQVKAFQTSLAAGQITGDHNPGEMDALAHQVAQIAHETQSLVDARQELNAALGSRD